MISANSEIFKILDEKDALKKLLSELKEIKDNHKKAEGLKPNNGKLKLNSPLNLRKP